MFYAEHMGWPPIWANAYDWWSGNAYADKYDRVAFNGKNRPPKGALVIWGPQTPGSGGAGHIAVAVSAPAGQNTFVSYDSNWGGKTAHQVTHDWNNVVGWLVPKTKPAPAQGGNDVSVIPDADNYYNRYGVKLARQLRGRSLTRNEFRKHIVGKTDLKAIELLSDDPEATRTQEIQNVGVVAVRDNWSGQIKRLKTEKDKMQKAINELNQTVTKMVLDDKLDKSKVEAGLARIGELTAELERVHDRLEEAEKAAAEAPAEVPGDSPNWLVKLLSLFRKKD